MRKFTLLTIAIISLLSLQVSAQTYRTGREASKADVNFTDLANEELAHPQPLKRKPIFEEEDEDRPRHTAVDPSKVFLYDPSKNKNSTLRTHFPFLPVSPAPTDTFLSTISDGTSIPPDTHGAVDSHYCVTAINTVVHIQTRTGANVSSVSEDRFWTSVLPGGPGSFDPRIYYDTYSGRWITVCLAYGQMTSSQLMIGVSATGNPTGTWHLYNILIDATGANWLDFGNVGFNRQWIVVSGNLFSNTGGASGGAQIYVFDKAALMSGAGATHTVINEPSSFCICPAITYDTAESSLYMLEASNGGAGQLTLWQLTGTATAPVINGIGNPACPVSWGNSGAGGADFAPQAGTANKIQTNDDRINNCVERNGKLWCSHNAFFPARSPARSSVMWWEIDTSGTVNQNGLIDDPTNTNFYAFGNISVNAANDALIGYSQFSGSTYPYCMYSLHMAADPADSMRPGVVFRHGQNNYYQTFGGADNRWGDYSGTCVDPANDIDFWTLQESVVSTPANIWDTWWAYVQVCPIPTTPVAVIAPITHCVGTTDLYSVSSAGASSYTWTVSGSSWSGSSTTDSINITAGSGIATVVVTAASSCGTSPAFTFTVTSATTPPAPSIGAITQACVGSPSALYSATATYATSYTWTVTGTGWSGTSTTSTIPLTVGTGSGTLTCVATNACGSSAATKYVITPATAPVSSSVISLPSPLCSGSIIKVVTPAVGTATGYVWAVAGSGWSAAPTSSDTLSVTIGTGPATISVYPINGCGSAAPYTITTGAPVLSPVVSFSILNHSTLVIVRDTLTYTGTDPAGTTFLWNFGSGAIPGSATGIGPESVIWGTAGLKTVLITVTDSGCITTYSDTVRVRNNVGIANINMVKNNFSIIPNPNTGTFDIVFDENIKKDFEVSVSDLNGRIVFTKKVFSLNTNKYTIVTNNLVSGNYNVSVIIDNELYTNKVTIKK